MTGPAVLAFVLALAIMLALPGVGYWPLLLLALVGPVERLVRR